MPFFQELGEQVDRTSLVFYTAGTLFTLGIWAFIFGFSTRTASGDLQYDAVSLLPGILAFSCFLALNLPTDRSVLSADNMAYFSTGNHRALKFFVFTVILVSMLSVAISILMAMIRYSPIKWYGMAWGISTLTFCITLASFIIFFARKVDTVYF